MCNTVIVERQRKSRKHVRWKYSLQSIKQWNDIQLGYIEWKKILDLTIDLTEQKAANLLAWNRITTYLYKSGKSLSGVEWEASIKLFDCLTEEEQKMNPSDITQRIR